MATSRKIYRRIGLRRDKNFSDLSNPKQGLNNLLDTLVDDVDKIDATFISEDLDVIRNIFANNLSQSGYRQFIGSSVKTSNTDGTIKPVVPRITYQNRLDKFETASGTPRLNGGNGLTANYFNHDTVNESNSEIFTGITTGREIESDNFWEAGNFNYTGKIHPQNINAAGGVKWEGFFIPTETGNYTFANSGTLSYVIDFEADGYSGSGIGTYTEYSRIGLAHTVNATTSGTNIVTVPTASTVNVGVGMSVTGTGIRAGTTVARDSTINRSTGAITLTNDDGDPIITPQTTSVTFSRDPNTSVSSSFTTQILQKYRRYRVRYKAFVPSGVNPFLMDKKISFTYVRPSAQTSSYLRYNNLYSLDYDFSESAKGTFNLFLDQSIFSGGGLIGGNVGNDYVRVSSTNKVDIRYQPKTELGTGSNVSTGIVRKEFTTSWSTGAQLISVSDTTNLEIGNYLFGAGLTADINTPARITDIIINKLLVLENPTTSSGSNVSITAVNHRGFVKRVSGSAGSGTINFTAGNSNDLKTGMVVIANGSSQPYIGITTSLVGAATTYAPNNQTLTGPLYFYEGRGLINKTLTSFCVPSETRCFEVTSTLTSLTTTVLPVKDVGIIAAGWRIKGFPFASGTKVQSVDPAAKTITLDTAITNTINSGAVFTATNTNNNDEADKKQLCCPPTDTSPPFDATEFGLRTTNSEPNLEITSGNLVFDTLVATVREDNSNLNKITEIADVSTAKSNNRIDLYAVGVGVTYKLLCV